MVEQQPERPAGTAEPQPVSHRRNAKDSCGLWPREVFEDGQAERLLMGFREHPPGPCDVDAPGGQINVGSGDRKIRCIRKAEAEGPASALTAAVVQEDVAADAEDPGTRVTGRGRNFPNAAPHHQEGVRDYVFGAVGIGSAADEPEKVRINRGIESPELLLPVRFTWKVGLHCTCPPSG